MIQDLIKETGLSGVGFSGNYGGHEFVGMDYLMKGVIMREIEAIDSGLRSIFSVQNSLVMMPIYWYGTEEQKRKWLPQLATFDIVGAYCQTEPNAGSDPSAMTTNAIRDGNEIRIVPADLQKAEEAEFIMLKDGGIHFEGTAAELRGSKDPYLRSFLS